jgi:hypothetical protein
MQAPPQSTRPSSPGRPELRLLPRLAELQHLTIRFGHGHPGSNPTVSANENPRETGGLLHPHDTRGAFLVRREAAGGTLHPAYRDGLARDPGWDGNPRAAANEVRWHDRLVQLMDFRAEGNEWLRHQNYTSELEHTLGVWIHSQRLKHHRDGLGPENVRLLDGALPGWQTGSSRGRPNGR